MCSGRGLAHPRAARRAASGSRRPKVEVRARSGAAAARRRSGSGGRRLRGCGRPTGWEPGSRSSSRSPICWRTGGCAWRAPPTAPKKGGGLEDRFLSRRERCKRPNSPRGVRLLAEEDHLFPRLHAYRGREARHRVPEGTLPAGNGAAPTEFLGDRRGVTPTAATRQHLQAIITCSSESHPLVFALTIALSHPIAAQGISPQCPPGTATPSGPDNTRIAQDACQKAIDLFQYMAPQLGGLLAGGNATQGLTVRWVGSGISSSASG